ncbi:hypothetical protein ACS0TY_020036 [Phlomoides rotata]
MRDIDSRPLVKEVCATCDQARLDFDSKKLQSYVKEKSLLISEKGVLSDKISPGVLRSMVTLTDKPKERLTPLLLWEGSELLLIGATEGVLEEDQTSSSS